MKIENKLRVITIISGLLPIIILLISFQRVNQEADAIIINILTAGLAISFLIGTILPFIFSRWLCMKQINDIDYFCDQIKEGHYHHSLILPKEPQHTCEENELTHIMRTLNWMGRQIELRQEELKKSLILLMESKEEMESLAMNDMLTEIPNRRSFFINVNQYFDELSHKLSNSVGLMILDIDFFKKINDQYGHDTGDIVLKVFASHLKNRLQGIATFARIGGEEFAIIMKDINLHQFKMIGEDIRTTTEQLNIETSEHGILHITISIGGFFTSFYEQLTPTYLYKQADLALYDSKENGRNRITIINNN